jgi:hypothetical protein
MFFVLNAPMATSAPFKFTGHSSSTSFDTTQPLTHIQGIRYANVIQIYLFQGTLYYSGVFFKGHMSLDVIKQKYVVSRLNKATTAISSKTSM